MPNDTENLQQFNTAKDLANAIAERLGAPEPQQEDDGWITYCPVHEVDWEQHSPSLIVFNAGNCHCRSGNCAGSMAGALRGLGIQPRAARSTDYPWDEVRRHVWTSGCGRYELLHIKEVAVREQEARGAFKAVHVGDKRFRWAGREVGSDASPKSLRNWEGTDQKLFDLHPEATPTLYKAAALGIGNGLAFLLVVEGEKDAESALALGVPATCLWQGAGQLTPAQADLLCTVDTVVVCGDNDGAGERYVKHLGAVLRARGRRVHHLVLDGLDEKGDLTDWLDMRKGDRAQALLEALDTAPELTADEVAAGAGAEVAHAWVDQLDRVRGTRALKSDTENWRLVLKNDTHLAVRLRWNVRLRQPEVLSAAGEWERGTDAVQLQVKACLDLYGRGSTVPSKGTCVELVKRCRPWYDPYSERLDDLPRWDGVERAKNLFGRYFGCVGDTGYLEQLSIIHFTGQMARILEPGAKHDYCPVLLGTEGYLKSTALMELCLIRGNFIEEGTPDRLDNAYTRRLVGAELVEFSEGQGFFSSKQKTDSAKSWVSRTHDGLDMKYLSHDDYPRTWVGVITANPDASAFFTALSGHRKFPLLSVEHPANIQAIREDFEQLFAEALHLVLGGVRMRIDYWAVERMTRDITRQHIQFNEAMMDDVVLYIDHTWSRPASMTGLNGTVWEPRDEPRDRVYAADYYRAFYGVDGRHVADAVRRELNRIMLHIGYTKTLFKIRNSDKEEMPDTLGVGSERAHGWEKDMERGNTPLGNIGVPLGDKPANTHTDQSDIDQKLDDLVGEQGTREHRENTGIVPTQTVDAVELKAAGNTGNNGFTNNKYIEMCTGEISPRPLMFPSAAAGVGLSSAADLERWISAQHVDKVLGLDFETGTDGLVRTVQVSDGDTALMVDRREYQDVLSLLQGRRYAAHNAGFEFDRLYENNITVELECTLIAHRVLTAEAKREDAHPRKHDLQTCVLEEHDGVTLNKKFQAASNWDGELTAEHVDYGKQDAVWAYRLWERYHERLADTDQLIGYRWIVDCLPAARAMHRVGFHLDRAGHANLVRKYRGMAVEALKHFAASEWSALFEKPPTEAVKRSWGGSPYLELIAGLNSPKHMTDALTYLLPTPVLANWKRGGRNKELLVLDKKYMRKQLEKLRHPDNGEHVHLVADLLEQRSRYMKANKLIIAFGESLAAACDEKGRLHGTFNLAKAATGRASCTDPNLQQMPNANDFRNLFTAPNTRTLVVGDYTQIEVRVFGLLANEPVIAEFFERGYDLHRASATMLFGVGYDEVTKLQRKAAKVITFGIIYGMGAESLAAALGCSVGEAAAYLDTWAQQFPSGAAWRTRADKEAHARGYILMADGRRVAVTPETRPSQCYNYPVQGSAASCQYVALAWLHNALQVMMLDADILAVVHDEMIVECNPHDAETVSTLFYRSMEEGVRRVFPGAGLSNLCSIAIGNDWSEKE